MIEPEDRDSAKLKKICEKIANQNHEMSYQTIRDTCIQAQESLSLINKDELNMVIQASSERESSGQHGKKEAISNRFKEFNYMQNVVAPPKLENLVNVSWCTADPKELAALVAHKAKEHLDNCDLPPSQSPSICEGLVEHCDLNPAKRDLLDVSPSMDKDPLISIFHDYEPACPENSKLPPSPLILGHSNPFTQPRKLSSSETRPSSWNGGEGFHNDCGYGSELLGQALCHSQTRAREAEEAEAKVFLEKEKLVRLLFREASLNFTYRQRIFLLQAENLCLQLHAGDQAAVRVRHNFADPSIAFAWLSNDSRKHKELSHKGGPKLPAGNVNSTHFKHKWSTTRSDVMVGCTIGLAFAFGLSLAGAGLSFILFTY